MRRVEVKICGLTSRDDAMVALEAGADYIGFVLYKGSPRGIAPGRLAGIVEKLEGEFRTVGVFVNTESIEAEKIARDCNLYAIQLNGDEDHGRFAGLGLRLWRSVRVQTGKIFPDPELWKADRYVADAVAPGLYGGTGMKTDWERVAELAREHNVMLAGGLTPDNVQDAICSVNPAGVDVASGVEKSPGKKDRRKVMEFIRVARICGAGEE